MIWPEKIQGYPQRMIEIVKTTENSKDMTISSFFNDFLKNFFQFQGFINILIL